MHVLALILGSCLVLAGCAAPVKAVPTQFTSLAAGQPAREITIDPAVTVQLSTGYTRVLAAGSRWRETGTIKDGTVYMPVGTVFTIEGRDVHEAYLVVRSGRIEGFYLVAEGRFSPLQPSISINTNTNTGGKQ
jgi:hypothetical protein